MKKELLNEDLNKEQFDAIWKELSYPDMKPQLFDKSYPAWFTRIGLWGKIIITHVDPEHNEKSVVTPDKFMKLISVPDLLKMWGDWKIVEHAVNKISFEREYVALNGKRYNEQFFVEIELDSALKKAVKSWWMPDFIYNRLK